ncbi:MAG TPA: thioredoxin TrxC [Aquabacterium sp.]|nr:thioredoxin TrxC [Aquabacterium sp.]HQC99014.1 thioredoxin TrxC [Aquabacterium sp.]
MDTHHIVCAHCGATNRLPADRLADDPDCGRCHRPLLAGAPIELDDLSFDRFVQNSTLPVLVDFWAPWCGPCRQMAPQFDAAARQLKGRALLVKVNSDDSPETSAKFGIRSIPTLVRLQGGVEQRRQSGAVGAAQIVALAG